MELYNGYIDSLLPESTAQGEGETTTTTTPVFFEIERVFFNVGIEDEGEEGEGGEGE